MKYNHVFPPLDTTTFDCVHKRKHSVFSTHHLRELYRNLGHTLAACIMNDSITKWKFTQTKILKKCPLIFQLYFIKEIPVGNLVPHWKELENLPKELAITVYFTHCLCVFQAESFLLSLASCTCHKCIN